MNGTDDRPGHPSAMKTDLPLPSFLRSFREGDCRLLLIDFDGTLAPIVNNPADARPSDLLKQILNRLSGICDVVVVSGRDRIFLEKTFMDFPGYLVAEHGAFLKKPDQPWERLDQTTVDWLAPIRATMKEYVTRFAGSFIEEKETGIVWHYRMVEAGDIDAQALELTTSLRSIDSVVPLTVIQGSKVVEVKPSRHNKGTVVLTFVQQRAYPFILCMGDDTTDEDMFRELPNWSYTLKVGPGQSFARYRLAHQGDVETLLSKLDEAGAPIAEA